MKKRYYFIIILVILIPILIVTSLIKDSNQVGYKEDKCYAGYFDTQFGTCFIYINPNIHSYIYFETKDDNCLINYENEEKTKELYGIMNNK